MSRTAKIISSLLAVGGLVLLLIGFYRDLSTMLWIGAELGLLMIIVITVDVRHSKRFRMEQKYKLPDER